MDILKLASEILNKELGTYCIYPEEEKRKLKVCFCLGYWEAQKELRQGKVKK